MAKVQDALAIMSDPNLARAPSAKAEEAHAEVTVKFEGLLNEKNQGTNEDILTYGYNILSHVVYEKYDTAEKELDFILGVRKNFPKFGQRASSYVSHAKTLVRAIESKRELVKTPHIPRAQRNDLMGALSGHFSELKSCILNIEKIEKHARREDIVSTRWFVLAVYSSILLVFLAAFLRDNLRDLPLLFMDSVRDVVHTISLFL